MATIEGTQKKLTVSGEAIESAVNSKHEHSNSAVLNKLSDNNGTLQYNGADITGGGSSYTLPTASETILGGVKVDGTTITVNPDGIISATSTGTGLTEEQSNNVAKIPTIENNVNTNTSSITELKEYKQNKTDNTLDTTDKTIVGAINEVKLSIPTRTSELENNSNFITNDDLPTVPTKVSDLENDSNFVTNSKMLEAIANAQLGNGEDSDIDLSAYQPIEESTLTTTAKTIPTAINELKSGLDDKVNKTDITTTINSTSTDTQIPSAKATYDLANTKANTNHTHNTSDIKGLSIPTKVSDLTNDSGFITLIPSEYITETELEAKGYLTEHQSLTDYAKKTDIPDVSSFITSDDLPTVPTKVSELTNDSNFITSIPEEYITETELKSNYYTKEEVGELLEEGGSGVYSTTTPVNNPIGGIKRGDKFTNKPISEIIDLMLHVVERVKVTLSSSVSGGVREIGDTSISTSTFTINVTKGTNPVVSVKLFKDSVEVQDFADVENGGSFTYDGGAITTDTKFEAKANDGDGDIASTAISYKFVSPMYIGSSDNGLEAFSETDATSLTKKIVDKNTKTIQAFTHTQQHMCFVVPNTWNGSPTIKDQNNFDITTAFNSKAIQVTGLDGVARDYIAFVSNDKSTLSNYSITITF